MTSRPQLVLALAALALIVSAASRAATTAEDDAVVREHLAGLERQSWVAWQNHDGKYFDQFLADDHVDVGPRGTTNKTAVVAGVAGGGCKVDSYALGEFQFTRIASDAAMLVYRAEQNTSCGAFRVPSPGWFTSVYVRRGGRWLNIVFEDLPAAKS